MVPSLGRSEREATHKRTLQKKERQKKSADKKKATRERKSRKATKKSYTAKSAARFDNRSMIRTMIYSAGILVIAFIVFELLLVFWKMTLPESIDFTREDTYWHLINIADTCIGFVIGLTAMDALTYFEQGHKSKRDEERAILRHNRIIKPLLDMYLSRKNGLITPEGEELKPFQVVSNCSVRDLKDMYGPSIITSDAKKPKIEAFAYYVKKLNVAFMNMAQDINFDYNPEVADAVFDFINETTYGYAALETIVSYGKEGNRTCKMALIRQIKEASDSTDILATNEELNNAMIVHRMIHAHEDALEKYLRVMEELDSATYKRAQKLH